MRLAAGNLHMVKAIGVTIALLGKITIRYEELFVGSTLREGLACPLLRE